MGLFSGLGSFFGPVGTAIGAGVDYFVGKKDSDDRYENQVEQTALQRQDNERQRQQEYERQKEFAQMGIRWRAADAEAAGFHPLAALGMQPGAGYSPTVVAGGSSPQREAYAPFDTSFLEHGQNTTRAQVATQSPEEKQLSRLAVRNAELRNALLEGQISQLWASVLGQPNTPPLPVSGVGRVAPTGAVQVVPSKQVSSRLGDPGVEAASTPGFKNYKLTPGGLSIDLPGQEMAESLDSMGPGAGGAIATIRGLDRFWSTPEAPRVAAPPGKKWVYSAWTGKYRLVDDKPPSWRGAVSGRGSSYRPGR